MCDVRIPIILRTDRRTCSDVCRKWSQRHPGHKRVHRLRGTVPLPRKVSLRKPKTLAEALRLLAETRAYAARLEASAEALALELTHQQNAQAELRAELIRERERTAQGGDAVTAAQERAQAAEQKVAELEKQLADAQADVPRSLAEANGRRGPSPEHQQLDRAASRAATEERNGASAARSEEIQRDTYDPPLLPGATLDPRRHGRDEPAASPQADRLQTPISSSPQPIANSVEQQAQIDSLRQQVTALTTDLDQARRQRRQERRELLDDLDDHAGKLRTLRQQLQKEAAVRAEWTSEKQTLTKQQEEQRAGWESEAAVLRRDLATQSAACEGLRGKIATLVQQHAEEQQRLHGKIAELSAECEARGDAARQADSRAAEHARARDDLQRRLSSLHTDYEDLGGKKRALHQLVSQWQAKAERAQNAEQDVKKTLEDERVTAKRQEQVVAEQQRQMASLTNEKREIETQKQDIVKKHIALIQGVAALDIKNQAAMKRLQQELESERAEHQRTLAELRDQLTTQSQTVDDLGKQLATVAEERRKWAAEKAELERSRDEHKGHVADAHRLAQMRERDHAQALSRTQERVSQEATEMVGSAERTLELERERRQSVEAMNEELRETMRRIELAALGSDGTPAWTAAQQEQALLRELKSLRQQRDGVSNERDLLSRRLLRLMKPGQYLAHATTANYDAVTDPLIALKRRELHVENDWAAIQEARNMRRRARKLDPEQTVDEQAYASALASRWRLIDRPHSRLPTPPVWRIIGFLLDEASEKYLLTIGEERIETITQKLAQGQRQDWGGFAG